MRRIAIVCLVVAGSLGAPQVAAGGGWWAHINVTRDHLAVGQRFGVVSEHLFDSIEAAGRAVSGKDRFYAYLLEGYEVGRLRKAMGSADPGDWLRTKGAVRLLGRVRFFDQDSNLVTAKAAFETPDLTPGRYEIMLCDEGCETAMADAVPAALWITTDLVAARAATKAQRISERLRERSHAMRSSNARLRKQVVSLKARLELVEQQIQTSSTRAQASMPTDQPGEALLLTAGAVAGGVLMLAVTLGLRKTRKR